MSYHPAGLGLAPLIAIAPATGPAAPFVAAASLVPLVFKAVSGLWTKDQCKVEYDAARQQFWDYEAGLFNVDPQNSWGAWEKAGTLTYDRGAWIINQLTTALDQFTTYTGKVKQSCDPQWVEERFRDYNDFWTARITELRAKLAQMDQSQMSAGSIMQGAYTAIARLVDPVAGQSYLPQSGTLPPVGTVPGVNQGSPVISNNGLLFGGLALAAGYLFFSRSR